MTSWYKLEELSNGGLCISSNVNFLKAVLLVWLIKLTGLIKVLLDDT